MKPQRLRASVFLLCLLTEATLSRPRLPDYLFLQHRAEHTELLFRYVSAVK